MKVKVTVFNTYNFSNHGNNKFILLLQKGVYPHEYMDELEKFNETSLPEKEDFYIHLNREILLIQITRTQKEFLKILK